MSISASCGVVFGGGWWVLAGARRESSGTTVMMKGSARGRNYTKRSPKWYSSKVRSGVLTVMFEVGFHDERMVPAARGHSLTIQVGDVGLRLISMNAGTAARGR